MSANTRHHFRLLKLHRNAWLLASVAVVSASVGCDKPLVVTLVDSNAHRPSNVVMFFSVEDSDGEPVVGLNEASFTLVEDGQPFSEFESNHVLLQQQRPYRLLTQLVLDTSGSIVDSGNLANLQRAVDSFVENNPEHQYISIALFDGRLDLVVLTEFTNSVPKLNEAVDAIDDVVELSKKEKVYDPSTNLYGAVCNGVSRITSVLRNANDDGEFWEGALVVFTDGTDRAHRNTLEDAVGRVTDAGVYAFAIGVQGEVDDSALKKIGKDGFFAATNVVSLSDDFDAVSSRLVAEAGKFYMLSYCSPSRSSDHEVTVIATDDEGRIGEVVYSFTARSFEAGCEPENGHL